MNGVPYAVIFIDFPGSVGIAEPACMTIGEIIAEPLRTYHPEMSRQEVSERVKAMMLKVGLLPNLINRYPYEFSGGKSQRIGLFAPLFWNRS